MMLKKDRQPIESRSRYNLDWFPDVSNYLRCAYAYVFGQRPLCFICSTYLFYNVQSSIYSLQNVIFLKKIYRFVQINVLLAEAIKESRYLFPPAIISL